MFAFLIFLHNIIDQKKLDTYIHIGYSVVVIDGGSS